MLDLQPQGHVLRTLRSIPWEIQVEIVRTGTKPLISGLSPNRSSFNFAVNGSYPFSSDSFDVWVWPKVLIVGDPMKVL